MKKTPENKERVSFWTISILIFFCLGVLLRLKLYLYNRSLWYDEASLALGIANSSFLRLLQPLDYMQVAPIGFLVIEKFLINSLGNNEYILRLFPFFCGITSLFLFYKVAENYLETKAIPIAIALFAILPSLIYYSSEVKQYSSDVMFTLLLLISAIHMQSRKLNALRIALFALIGTTSIWFSHPAVFILAGIGISSILLCLINKDKSRLLRLLIVYLIWVLSFIILYCVNLNNSVHNKILLDLWSNSFMPLPPKPIWLANAFLSIFSDAATLLLEGLAALTFLYGCIMAFLNKKFNLVSLVLPIFFALVASGLHKYPFMGRLLLFLVPIVILLIAEGIEQIRVKAPIIRALIIGLLFFFPLQKAYGTFTSYAGREEIRPVINYVKEHELKGDMLYLYDGSQRAFLYYAGKYGFDKNSYVKGTSSRDNWFSYVNDLNKLRGNKRVWLLFSHVCTWQGINEEEFFLQHLNNIGTQKDVFKCSGAAVYLYDLSKTGENILPE